MEEIIQTLLNRHLVQGFGGKNINIMIKLTYIGRKIESIKLIQILNKIQMA